MNFGMNLRASYKNFQLSVLLQGASKFSIYINGPAATMFSNGSIPLSYHYKYAWQPHPDDPSININPDAILPASSFSTHTNNSRVSDFWLRDVRYLKNINISYNIPNNIISKIGLNSTQLYLSTENIFT